MPEISDITASLHAHFLQQAGDDFIDSIVCDSRKIVTPASTLFFALKTSHRNGHDFLADAYSKGVRNFVISEPPPIEHFANANLLVVGDPLVAMQKLAADHRAQFSYPVIGITGSNGKTVVKEWIYHILQENLRIVRSPRSYNSQIGVPLSVWQMSEKDELGIFEAGISKIHEMDRLEAIIRPTIGVLTNIGSAHDEGFMDRSQKLDEKLRLFQHSKMLIGRNKDIGALHGKLPPSVQLMSWGHAHQNAFVTGPVMRKPDSTVLTVSYKDEPLIFSIPFIDEASIENATTVCCTLLAMNISRETIIKGMASLPAIDMRLQLNKSFHDCVVINDSYSADLTSLRIALDFMDQQSGGLEKTLIISDLAETGRPDAEIYGTVEELVRAHRVKHLIAIGERISSSLKELPGVDVKRFQTTTEFASAFRSSQFNRQIILVKGARSFGFEKIIRLFEKKQHQTVLEINLDALVHNLRQYRKLLQPETMIMAMVKAFAYGSGGAEIAGVLQYNHVNYLGVAYADEGVELVRAGISLPIMVMNPEPSSFRQIVDSGLEPVLYDPQIFNQFTSFLITEGLYHYPVHVEIETGMNRLGFNEEEYHSTDFGKGDLLRVRSVFSHLAASEDPHEDGFTLEQQARFMKATKYLEDKLEYKFIKHLSNSGAASRLPSLQMDMVRLGIGMYGIDPSKNPELELFPVATLRSTISQIKHLKAGESVSYNRKGIVHRDSMIATVRIGYADGYSRHFGNGSGFMSIDGKMAPTIGTVCMDMTMIDITGISNVQVGDEVEIFGKSIDIVELAERLGTIPYEIMTSISQRVNRVYYME